MANAIVEHARPGFVPCWLCPSEDCMYLFSDLAWNCIAAESLWPHATPILLVDLSFPCYKGLPLMPPSLQHPDKEDEVGQQYPREGRQEKEVPMP